MATPTLRRIFDDHKRLGSDKWTSYFQVYDQHFHRYRNEPISLLEIGVQNGGSLEIWGEFFPKAKRLLGCDIDPNCAKLTFDDPRIGVIIGDANAPATLLRITEDMPSFDIIIDDGSHIVEDVIRSFALYFEKLNPGGTYVVEDLHTSYWSQHGGGSDLNLSSMGFLKLLADLANKGFWRSDRKGFNFLGAYAKRYGVDLRDEKIDIEEISFSDSICVIRKGNRTFQNRRHITGNQFHVVDYSEEKTLSGTSELVDRLNVNGRLTEATERQQEFVTLIPSALANNVEIGHLREQFAQASLETEKIKQDLQQTMQILVTSRSEIAALYSSKSWRFTSPLRYCVRFLAAAKLWRRK